MCKCVSKSISTYSTFYIEFKTAEKMYLLNTFYHSQELKDKNNYLAKHFEITNGQPYSWSHKVNSANLVQYVNSLAQRLDGDYLNHKASQCGRWCSKTYSNCSLTFYKLKGQFAFEIAVFCLIFHLIWCMGRTSYVVAYHLIYYSMSYVCSLMLNYLMPDIIQYDFKHQVSKL